MNYGVNSIKHKGLKKLFEPGVASGIQPQHANRLRQTPVLLETADSIDDMDLPGLNLHELNGQNLCCQGQRQLASHFQN